MHLDMLHIKQSCNSMMHVYMYGIHAQYFRRKFVVCNVFPRTKGLVNHMYHNVHNVAKRAYIFTGLEVYILDKFFCNIKG